jgi:predicted GIY-YIG superfamily endonuclease
MNSLSQEKQFFVYLLVSSTGATYVGATVDLNRRLRQHNKEIKGGAHATSAKVKKGEVWERACHVRNFPDWQAALQFEWKWKQVSRKKSLQILPLERRIIALKEILKMDKPTSKAKCFSEWDAPPEVILEIQDAELFYCDNI